MAKSKSVMLKHETVMHRQPYPGDMDRVPFSSADPDDVSPTTYDVFALSRETWNEMDQPDTITVTVVPEDTLNTEDKP